MSKVPEKFVYYFCDESSQVDDEFMGVAGLAVPDVALTRITDELLELKERHGNPTEVKWSKVKDRRDCPWTAFADYFEREVKAQHIHFHVRFAPFAKYDHKLSGPQQRADTTGKMHFQLLLHRAVRIYGPHYKLRIRPDNGTCTSTLPKMVDRLHWMGQSQYQTPHDCIDSIQCLDSEREILLQLLDVPLGAFTALRNARQLGGAKTRLAEHIRAKWPDIKIEGNSPKNVIDFSVWNVMPSGPKKRGPWS